MKMMNRREALGAVSAFALMAKIAEGQAGAGLGGSKVFKFDDFPMTHNPSGAAVRGLKTEDIPAGGIVYVHITVLEAGQQYAPLHKNPDHEFLMVQKGKIELLVEGKAPQPAGVGDIVYAAANEMRTTRNPGPGQAMYFVVAIGEKA